MTDQEKACTLARDFLLNGAAGEAIPGIIDHLMACPVCGPYFASHESEFAPLLEADPFEPLTRRAVLVSQRLSQEGFPVTKRGPSSWQPPTIPGYEILEILGETRLSVVHVAKQCSLNRLVALKLVISSNCNANSGLVSRESDILASLAHPHILGIHETGTWERGIWLALEYCPAGSIADTLPMPWDPPDAATLVIAVAQAVQVAHNKGIIHYDIKPANILIGLEKQPKLADFGLAQAASLASSPLDPVSVLGTASYMAPEQAKSLPCDHRVDIHALGAVLYTLLTGRAPFKAENGYEALLLAAHALPPTPAQLNPGITAALSAVCMKCLAKDPADRYASAGDLAADLNRFLAGKPVLALPLTLRQRVLGWPARHPVLTGVMILAAIGLAGTLSLFATLARHQQVVGELAERSFQMKYLSYNTDISLMRDLHQNNALVAMADILNRYVPEQGAKDLRGWEWEYCKSLLPGDQVEILTTFYRAWGVTASGSLVGMTSGGEVFNHEGANGWKARQVFQFGQVLQGEGALSPDASHAVVRLSRNTLAWVDMQRLATGLQEIGVCNAEHVSHLAITNDGKWILAYDSVASQLLRIDTVDGKTTVAHDGKIHPQQRMRLNPAGTVLVFASVEGNLHFYDILEKKLVVVAAAGFQCADINWSSDGQRVSATLKQQGQAGDFLIAGIDGTSRVIPQPQGTTKAISVPTGPETIVIFEESGRILEQSAAGKTVFLAPRDSRMPFDCLFTPQEKTVFVRGAAGFSLIPLRKLVEPRRFHAGHTIRAIHWLDAGRFVPVPLKKIKGFAMGANARVLSLAEAASQPGISVLPENAGVFWPSRLRNGGWLYSDQHQVMLCEPDGKPVKTVAFRVKAVTTSQDRIACLGLDGTTRIFDENLALLPGDFETPEATRITLSGEGGLWYFDLGMKLFHLKEGKPVAVALPEGFGSATVMVPGKKDTVWVALSGGNVVEIGPDGLVRRQIQTHSPRITCMELHPAGDRLVVSSFDQVVRWIDLNCEREILSLSGINHIPIGLHFSPDGGKLAIASINGEILVLP